MALAKKMAGVAWAPIAKDRAALKKTQLGIFGLPAIVVPQISFASAIWKIDKDEMRLSLFSRATGSHECFLQVGKFAFGNEKSFRVCIRSRWFSKIANCEPHKKTR